MGLFDWLRGEWFDVAPVGPRPSKPGGFPRYAQLDDYSCAARSTQMILKYYKRPMRYGRIKEELGTDEDGTSMTPVERLLRKKGFSVTRYRTMSMDQLTRCLVRGVVLVDVDGDHVAVVHDIDDRFVHIADPSTLRCPTGRQTRRRFRNRWERRGLSVTDPIHGRPTAALHVPLELRCSLTDEDVEVACADGEYECPCCGETIGVTDGEAEHAELDTFECPATHRRTAVPHEETRGADHWLCPECNEPVLVRELQGLIHVLHGLEYI